MGFFDTECDHCKSIIKKNDEIFYLSKPSNNIYNGFMEMMTSKEDFDNFDTLCPDCCKIEKDRVRKLKEATLKNSPLIACPDCNKSISKRATACPNCGCPISDILTSTPEEVKSVLPQSTTINKPKCPTCDSTNIEKISLANKAGSVALVGIFALGRVSKCCFAD